MPTEITQTDVPDSDVTILKVSGELMDCDAIVLERIAKGIREETGRRVIIDLADLDLLDSDAASSVRRIDGLVGVSVEGIEIFVQASIDRAEHRGA